MAATDAEPDNGMLLRDTLYFLRMVQSEDDASYYLVCLLEKMKGDTSRAFRGATTIQNLAKIGAYEAIAEHVDLAREVDIFWGGYRHLRAEYDSSTRKQGRRHNPRRFYLIWKRLAALYQVFKAIGDVDAADNLATMVLAEESRPGLFYYLARAGYQSGRADEKDLAMAETAFAMAGDKNIEAVVVYIRLLNHFGFKEKARHIFDQAEKDFEEPDDQRVLQTCASSFHG